MPLRLTVVHRKKNLELLLAEKACSECELSSLDLSGKDLSNADLRGANLYGANLAQANLQGANLEGAMLGEANLTGTDLQDADLTQVNLYETNLAEANLTNANLTGTIFVEVNLQGANLEGADLSDTVYTSADFSGANLKGAIGFDSKHAQNTTATKITFDSATILPDGSSYVATADTDGSDDTSDPEAVTVADNSPNLASKLSDLEIGVACKGEPVAGATPYDEANLQGRPDVIRPISTHVKESDGNVKYNTHRTDYLSDSPQWLADNPALVLCAHEVPKAELLETCPYEEGAEVRRYYSELELTLVETATAEVIASQTLGKEADTCPAAVRLHGDNRVQTNVVTDFDQVFAADINQFVSAHVGKFQ